MKTLDEVIKALEICSTDDDPCDKCPYTEFDKNGVWACSMCGDFAEDALHYLKEYRAILPLVPSLINTALEVQKKGKTIG